jgi:hypothetical protein
MASSASGSSCSCVIVEEQWKRCMEILETAENNWLGHLRRRNNRNILSQGEITKSPLIKINKLFP